MILNSHNPFLFDGFYPRNIKLYGLGPVSSIILGMTGIFHIVHLPGQIGFNFFFIAMENSITSSHLYDGRMFHKKNECKILFGSKVMTWYWSYAMKTDKMEENKIKIEIQ